MLLFRFALREGDWLLAAALARALSGETGARRELERELRRSAGRAEERTLPALQLVAGLIMVLGLNGAPG